MDKMIHKNVSAAVQAFYNDKLPAIEMLEINKGDGIAVGHVRIERSAEDRCMTLLHDDVRKDYMEKWNEDVGGLLRKDFRKGIFDGYYKMMMGDLLIVLREINPDDIDFMESKGFVHLKSADKAYTIIRICGSGDSFGEYEGKKEKNIDVEENSQISEYSEEKNQEDISNQTELF